MSDALNYIQYLEQPGRIPLADKDLFHSWVNEFPAIPIFRVLLAARYQSENHPDTAHYIEQAAFYAQDRKQLKNLLRNWQQKIESTATETAEEIIANTTELIPENITEEQPLDSVNDTESTEEDNSEKDILTETEENQLQEIIHSGTSSDELITDKALTEVIEIETEVAEIEPISDTYSEVDTDHSVEIDAPSETPQDVTTTNPAEFEISSNTEQEVENSDIQPTQSESYVEIEISITEEDDEIDEIIDPAIEELITEADDIAFLKAINKYEEPLQIDSSKNDDWELEAPIYHIPEISENAIIDSGLVATDISWLTPWLEEFSTPVLSATSAKPIATDIIKKEITALSTENTTPQVEEIQEVISDKPISTLTTPVENSQKQGTHSFDEWLSILEQKKQNSEEAPVFDLPSPEVFDKKEIQAIEEKEFAKSDTEALEKELKTEGESSVKKLAAESVSFKQDMATETLAKLYIRQGKIDLAITIYHQLIDKFPEKSTYFAGQINRLK